MRPGSDLSDDLQPQPISISYVIGQTCERSRTQLGRFVTLRSHRPQRGTIINAPLPTENTDKTSVFEEDAFRVNRRTKLIHAAANVADITPLPELLHGQDPDMIRPAADRARDREPRPRPGISPMPLPKPQRHRSGGAGEQPHHQSVDGRAATCCAANPIGSIAGRTDPSGPPNARSPPGSRAAVDRRRHAGVSPSVA